MPERNNRSRKTERALKEVFLQELQNKSVEKVSVTDLCRRAELDRSTFYLHYYDVFALMREIEKDELEIIRSHAAGLRDTSIAGEAVVKDILTYLSNRRDTFAVLLKEGSTGFWDGVRDELKSLFKDKVIQQYKDTAVFSRELDDIIVFLTNGFYGIYRRWLQSDLTDDLDYIAKLSTRLSTACLNEVLHERNQ